MRVHCFRLTMSIRLSVDEEFVRSMLTFHSNVQLMRTVCVCVLRRRNGQFQPH